MRLVKPQVHSPAYDFDTWDTSPYNLYYDTSLLKDINGEGIAFNALAKTFLHSCYNLYIMQPIDKYLFNRITFDLTETCTTLEIYGHIEDWSIICDYTNNTPFSIDNKQIYAYIYYTDSRSPLIPREKYAVVCNSADGCRKQKL